MFCHSITLKALAITAGLLFLPATGSIAQTDVFAGGWQMNTDQSILRFQSIKNETKVESSTFAKLHGSIDDEGEATIQVALDSVDTKVDLRNVRMRFMFFETFKYPIATVRADLNTVLIEDLPSLRRKRLPIDFTLNLHGITRKLTTDVTVTLLDNNTISVMSYEPVQIPLADFDLTDGIARLEAAAKVDIVPSATVTFDFVFSRVGSFEQTVTSIQNVSSQSAALEPQGRLSYAACEGRFDILSQSEGINFAYASAEIEPRSIGFLDDLIDIVNRCPEMRIEIGGHTDSDGPAIYNQQLSEARAYNVQAYLRQNSIPAERTRVVGYGETRPVAPNTTDWNKRRNRRIEFLVVSQ